MLRSQTVLTIHDLYTQGKNVQEIAQELEISRTTVRKYLTHPEAAIPKPRPPRPSKLDPFKEQINKWIMEDHCTNCEVIFERLQKMGYTGRISILKEYVQPLRPAVAGHAPVQRYETKPGEQVQFDWGEFVYEHEGQMRKFYGFTAILGYSRMRFVTFVKRCDTPTLIRCLMEAFEYFGGLTKVALTDRMKSVLLEMEENKPRWNPRFADFMVSIGVAPRVCKAYTPQTKGKVERTVSHVTRFEPTGPGAVLVCSDGLWNYQPGAAGLAELALPAALTDPLGAACTLLKFALEAGGMDNITVVLAPFPLVRPATLPREFRHDRVRLHRGR